MESKSATDQGCVKWQLTRSSAAADPAVVGAKWGGGFGSEDVDGIGWNEENFAVGPPVPAPDSALFSGRSTTINKLTNIQNLQNNQEINIANI